MEILNICQSLKKSIHILNCINLNGYSVSFKR